MTTPPDRNQPPPADSVRPHEFDGIQEYDNRLPNWWLVTFYGAIVFSIIYLSYYKLSGVAPSDGAQVEAELVQIEAARLSAAGAALNDDTLWQMSRNPEFVSAGRLAFNTNCATCHLTSLRGKSENPQAIGVDLTDQEWIYGGRPMQILATVMKGTPKGMPTWGPVLGQRKISQAVAYVLSHHQPGEPGMGDAPAKVVANH